MYNRVLINGYWNVSKNFYSKLKLKGVFRVFIFLNMLFKMVFYYGYL